MKKKLNCLGLRIRTVAGLQVMKINALILLSLICVNFSFSQPEIENCNQFQMKVEENMVESFLSNLSDELLNLSNGVYIMIQMICFSNFL